MAIHRRTYSQRKSGFGGSPSAGSWSDFDLLAEISYRTYISEIERGIRNPSLKNILKIAQALGVTPSKLLLDAENYILVSKGGKNGHPINREEGHS